MSMQPDFNLWSKWFTVMNLEPQEVITNGLKGSYDLEESEFVNEMILTGKTFTGAKDTWSGLEWEYMRKQLSDYDSGREVIGHDRTITLVAKPSRDELMFGKIVPKKDLFGFS